MIPPTSPLETFFKTSQSANPKIMKAFETVYLIRRYYKCLKNNSMLPIQKLPSLKDMLSAQEIAKKYIEAKPSLKHIELLKAIMKPQEVVLVWSIINLRGQSCQLGTYELKVS